MRAITRLAVAGACAAGLSVLPVAAAHATPRPADRHLYSNYSGQDPHGAFDICALAADEERSRGRC